MTWNEVAANDRFTISNAKAFTIRVFLPKSTKYAKTVIIYFVKSDYTRCAGNCKIIVKLCISHTRRVIRVASIRSRFFIEKKKKKISLLFYEDIVQTSSYVPQLQRALGKSFLYSQSVRFFREKCYTSDIFKGCVDLLLLTDDLDKIQEWIRKLNGLGV